MTLISWLSDIPLYISTTTFYPFSSFLAYLRCIRVEVLVNRAALKFGVPMSCRFLCFRIYTPMSVCAVWSVSLFVRCFRKHHTLLQSGHWQFTSHPSAKQGFLFYMACSAFLVFTLFQEGIFDGSEVRLLCSGDLHCPLVGLSKKGVYVFFWIYSRKLHTPFLANCIIVKVLPLFMCFKGESNLSLESCVLQFCLYFTFSSLPYFNIFLVSSYHL